MAPLYRVSHILPYVSYFTKQCSQTFILPHRLFYFGNKMVKGKHDKGSGDNLISRASAADFTFTVWSRDLFSLLPFQLLGEHTALQSFQCQELIVHIAMSVLPFSPEWSETFNGKVPRQGHNIETTMSQCWERINPLSLFSHFRQTNLHITI